MKKLLLVALLALFGMQLRAAEQFDELDLLGGWELQSCTGTYPFFTSGGEVIEGCHFALVDCKYLYFGDIVWVGYEAPIMQLPGYSNWVEVNLAGNGLFYPEQSKLDDPECLGFGDAMDFCDFFISNGNKLHLQFEFQALHFVIESLNSSEMHLRSFDGKCKVVYKRIGNSSVNAIASEDSDSESTYYSLDGVATSNPSHGIYVEKNGAKAKKVLKK